jgi:hypothetical protein
MPAATKRKEQDERNPRPTNEAAIAANSETASGSPTRFRVVAHPETSPATNSNASEEQVDVELTPVERTLIARGERSRRQSCADHHGGANAQREAAATAARMLCPLPAHIHDPHEPAAVKAKATRCPQLATGRRRLSAA